MIPEDLIAQFRYDRDLYYETARRAIDDVYRNLDEAMANLDRPGGPWVRTTVGGGHALNYQRWLDAEEALVRFWDAAGVVANLERENERILQDDQIGR